MADRRIYLLPRALTLTGKYMAIDKSGNSMAESVLVTDALGCHWTRAVADEEHYPHDGVLYPTEGSDFVGVGRFETPTSDHIFSIFDVEGSIGHSIEWTTSDLTLDETHYMIECDASSNSITITLPDPTECYRRVYIVQAFVITNVVNVYSSHSAINHRFISAGEIQMFQSDGTHWRITSLRPVFNYMPSYTLLYKDEWATGTNYVIGDIVRVVGETDFDGDMFWFMANMTHTSSGGYLLENVTDLGKWNLIHWQKSFASGMYDLNLANIWETGVTYHVGDIVMIEMPELNHGTYWLYYYCVTEHLSDGADIFEDFSTEEFRATWHLIELHTNPPAQKIEVSTQASDWDAQDSYSATQSGIWKFIQANAPFYDLNTAMVWESGITYHVGDIITFNMGTYWSYWYCKGDHVSTGAAPYEEIAYWRYIEHWTNPVMTAIETGTDINNWLANDEYGATLRAIALMFQDNFQTLGSDYLLASDYIAGSDFVQIQSDWTQADENAVDFIKNKPTGIGGLEDVAFEFRDVTAGSDVVYILDIQASFEYNILSTVLQSDENIDNVSINIEGTPVGGLNGLSVTSTKSDAASTSAYYVDIGDQVTLEFPDAGDATLIRGKIVIDRI